MNKRFLDRYARVILTIYSLIFLLRVFETSLILYNYSFSYKIIISELLGFFIDVLGVSIFLIIYAIISYIFLRVKLKILKVVNIILLLFTTLVFLLIIKYFLYQLIPLDIFLYQYSIKEIFFTVSTSGTDIFLTVISFVLLLFVVLLSAWFISKIEFNQLTFRLIYIFVLASIPLYFVFNSLIEERYDKYSLNKPIYFISKSIKYFSNSKEIVNVNRNEIKELYSEKDFISEEYPLVHRAERDNVLGKYFYDFNRKPNIVILIVEGLSDDFIHEYKGAVLMPFLSQLKAKSLYWEHCFTLGERSFAAVPSILGGLPYGNKGFTLQERLPRHLSLVSILNSNDYYTSFYYGQGSWFHQKDRFFKYNDIDLIFDNSKFSDRYSKIIVGGDNFFWGYNDKDLFNQSLNVLDTLNQKTRLDIYFTGTSHSPYIINNEEYYNKRLKEITTEPYKEFYQTYSKYVKSVLFVDDALKQFFNEYEKRNDYDNTIFIITGDHPMTEIPISNSLKRYHVPLLIFSVKLKENHIFKDRVSHLDISESVLSFLQNYLTNIPQISTSLGGQLIYNEKDYQKNIAFMNDNREVVDFLSGDYYLSEGEVYCVDSLLNISAIRNDSVKLILENKLNLFKNMSLYSASENKIIPSNLYCKALRHQNIYDFSLKDTLKISSEYYNLTDNITIPNTHLTFDISLNIKSEIKEGVSVVYQITNSNDSIVLWSNFGAYSEKITQNHCSIDKLEIAEDELFFKSYIWNKNKDNLVISDIDILLHRSEPTSHNVYTK